MGMSMKSLRWVGAAGQVLGVGVGMAVTIRMSRSRWAPWLVMVLFISLNMLLNFEPGNFRAVRANFPLLAFIAYSVYLVKKQNIWIFISGVLAGLGLGMGTEFGIAGVLALVVGLIIDSFISNAPSAKKMGVQTGLLFGGLAAVIIPFFVIYAVHGSLGALFARSTEYAGAFTAGRGNWPFPEYPWISILAPETWNMQTWTFKTWKSPVWITETPLLMYIPPLIYLLAGVELLARLLAGRWNNRATFRAMVLLYGTAAFRAVMGRSDSWHLTYASFAASILFVWELEQAVKLTFRLWRKGPRGSWVLFPTAYVALTILAMTFILKGPISVSVERFKDRSAGWFTERARQKWEREGWVMFNDPRSGGIWLPARRARQLKEITNYIKSNTSSDEPIFLIPDHGIIYFLAARRSVTRFDIAIDAVTTDHRKEVAKTLLEKKPLVLKFRTQHIDFSYDVEHKEEMAVLNKYYRKAGIVGGAQIYLPK